MNKKLIKDIIKEIEMLVFWYRNLQVAKNLNDDIEIERSDKNIKFIFNQLDNLNLTYRTQNDILHKLYINSDIYIKDLIKNTIFYFKDNTVVAGKEII